MTTIAGPAIRLKPRTACTRSSSPAPANTTRASNTRAPNHAAIAKACAIPATAPNAARSPPVRLRPIVATASVGNTMAGSCVVGSITRSGRATTHPVSAVSTNRASAARPGQPALVRSSHAAGDRPLPNDSPLAAAAYALTYKHGADHGDDPRRPQEPDGHDVLRALRPRQHDQHERAEDRRQTDRGQQPTEPDRPGRGHFVGHGRRHRRWCRWSWWRARVVVAVGVVAGTVVAPGLVTEDSRMENVMLPVVVSSSATTV